MRSFELLQKRESVAEESRFMPSNMKSQLDFDPDAYEAF